MSDSPLRLATPPADDRPTPAPALEPLLVSANELARLLGLSLRSIRAMDRAGRLPKPLRLGRRVVWRYGELRDWIGCGAPDRQTWARLRDARK